MHVYSARTVCTWDPLWPAQLLRGICCPYRPERFIKVSISHTWYDDQSVPEKETQSLPQPALSPPQKKYKVMESPEAEKAAEILYFSRQPIASTAVGAPGIGGKEQEE